MSEINNNELATLCQYVDWKRADARLLYEVRDDVIAAMDDVIDAFYERVVNNSEAKEVLSLSNSTVEVLMVTLRAWMLEVFNKGIDETFFLRQKKIGARHVKVLVPLFLKND